MSGRTDRPALCGAPGPARSLVGMCLLSSLQLLLNLTGESRENELAPGSRGRRVRRAREPVGWEPMGRARGEPRRPGGAAAQQARRARSAAQVRRDLGVRDPQTVGKGGVPGEGAATGTWRVKKERGREGDLEEGCEVRSGRLFRFISIAPCKPLPEGVRFYYQHQSYLIAAGLIWG